MQYTTHYNLNLPEGTDIVNPLIQDNPNYSAIDTALYDNKLRVIGNATHVKTGTNHAITLADSDIVAFKFVATGDYVTGDTFTVDGVTVTARVADGSTIPGGAFKINSTVEAIIDGTILNLVNVDGTKNASAVFYDNTSSGLSADNVQDAIDEVEVLNQGLAQRITDLEGVRYGANSMVNISSYDSETNYYTTPSEGYVRVETTGDEVVIVGGATLLEAGGKAVSVYVHKGAMIYGRNGNSNASSLRFIPLRI